MPVGTVIQPTVMTPTQATITELGLADADLLARNKDLANILALISAYYVMDGDKNRARAFGNASNNIAQWPNVIISGAQARRDIKGIGDSIQTAIDEFLNTGMIQRLYDLEKKFVDRKNTIDLFRSIHGIGPVTAVKFYNQGYRTLEDLWFRAKLTDAQKIGMLWKSHFELRIPYEEMMLINGAIGRLLDPYGIKWAIAGSFRRREPSSGDVDVLVESRPDLNMEGLVYILNSLLPPDTKLASGATKYMGVIRLSNQYNGHRIDIRLVPPENWGPALMYFTGSQRFNILMRQRAIQFALTLNEYGLYDQSMTPQPVNTEEDIFNVLRVQYIPPEGRTKTIPTLTYI